VLLRRKKCNTYSSDVLLIGLSNDLWRTEMLLKNRRCHLIHRTISYTG
jgi:hypothetical protein